MNKTMTFQCVFPREDHYLPRSPMRKRDPPGIGAGPLGRHQDVQNWAGADGYCQPQREDLVEGLSALFIDERVMYYVEWYGFYEGHT